MELQSKEFSFTALDTWQKCHKKWYYRYIRRLDSKTVAPALDFGKALHCGFSTFYAAIKDGKPRPEALDLALADFRANYTDREGEDKRTVANGEKVLRGYEEIYRAEPFKLVTQEVGFCVPVENFTIVGENARKCKTCGAQVAKEVLTDNCPSCEAPWVIMLSGYLDALIEWDGVLYVLEHKTTTMLNSIFFNQFELSMQVDIYVYAAEQTLGRKCLGAVMNAVEIWKDVMRVTEKTKKLSDHYARDIQNRQPHEMDGFLNDVPLIVRDIERTVKEDDGSGRMFVRTKSSCFSYNYKCPYWDLCKHGEDDKVIARDFVVRDIKPANAQVEGQE